MEGNAVGQSKGVHQSIIADCPFSGQPRDRLVANGVDINQIVEHRIGNEHLRIGGNQGRVGLHQRLESHAQRAARFTAGLRFGGRAGGQQQAENE